MSNPFITTPMLASGYLNGEKSTIVGKTATGSPVTFTSQSYLGQLGKIYECDDADAARLSDTTIGTLRGGVYMLVKTKAGSSASPARGIGCFWDAAASNGLGNYTVTPDITAPLVSLFAGVYINAPAKGDYCWIQIGGLATLLCKTSSVTSNVIGDVALFTGLTTNTFDALADATDGLTSMGVYKRIVGTWYEAPAADALKLAWLQKVARYC